VFGDITMTESALSKIMGEGPSAKITEHLLIGREFEYTVEDIHEATKVSRITITRKLKQMIKDGLVKETKKIGKSQLYRIDMTNSIVQALIGLTDSVIKKQEEKIALANNIKPPKETKCLKFTGYIYLAEDESDYNDLRGYASKTPGRLIMYDEYGKKNKEKATAFTNLGAMINLIEKERSKRTLKRVNRK
jgi:DNA-binding transcriptional ArsR family regulator